MSQRNDSLPTLYFEPAVSVDSLSSTVPYIQPPPPAYINPPRYSIMKDPETATLGGCVHRVDIGRLQGIESARTGATETEEEIC
ncbi:hypothetical protein SERLA73DRAFT_182754 [Serpula lacrymans var. lacrymans S7.3]|uniref:Uncharacterized protein n=2 Tax=Serpula lacrymans var. lacrymans TaxID=341189 RepID=F8Q0W7_SERL3|nr:uncharacterized protein SERLADRAFT_469557 [Serpula lacrymans var. lacrymans S7.9]EGN97945.1 hypothetical protein SERLA73DRAFT_182754 [Serpula lacrymans var. lacrymans S7.3]EGO23533.1 hypothetical protein SERLADRAFT_469557 [Serpula lacrymans var. lacrymans S7.9]